MIEKELKSNRLIFKNKDFIVFSNYAGRFPFEIHIYPFRHVKSLAVLTDDCIHSLAEALMIAMKAYKSVLKEIDYNMVLHTAPKGKDYHFHIEIYPQINRFGSVEYGTDVNINTVSPETSAKMLRDALR